MISSWPKIQSGAFRYYLRYKRKSYKLYRYNVDLHRFLLLLLSEDMHMDILELKFFNPLDFAVSIKFVLIFKQVYNVT